VYVCVCVRVRGVSACVRMCEGADG
jgi:hypothetical protein